MNFSIDLLFLLFGSVVYLIYLALPKKARPFCLLFFSIAFFVLYSKFLTIFLLLTIVTIYLGGKAINHYNDKYARLKEGLDKEQRKKLKARFNRKKSWLVFGVVAINVFVLVFLKYLKFFNNLFEGFLSLIHVGSAPVLHLMLPLGISYYTLTAIGYLVDVNRGKYRAGNFWEVALFISYFPHLYEGPFARFDQLSPQLQAGTGYDSNNFFEGLLKILWGGFKKMVVADRLGIIVGAVFGDYAKFGGPIILLAMLFFTFQLYAEFSGLIDIAQGISKLFGINLSKNFNQPFFSESVSEFWRRWHISLGEWFKDYVFYSVSMSKPLTKLNKKLSGKVNTFFQVFIPSAIALFAVWFLNGIWHGSGMYLNKYIVYGMYYYVLMMLGMCVEPLANLIYSKAKINKNNLALKILRIVRTFVLVNFGLLIFRATNLAVAGGMIAQIFKSGSINLVGMGVIDVQDFVMCFVGIASLVVSDIILEKKIDVKAWFVKRHIAIKCAIILLFVVAILVFGAYGNGYVPADPIYGAF